MMCAWLWVYLLRSWISLAVFSMGKRPATTSQTNCIKAIDDPGNETNKFVMFQLQIVTTPFRCGNKLGSQWFSCFYFQTIGPTVQSL